MKLNEKDFIKSTDDNYITYQYSCNGNTFYLKIDVWTNRIYVYANDEWDTSADQLFKTQDYIKAWTKLEELILACAPSQESSGGFSNPQNNPKLLPLLAIKETYNKLICVFFAQLDDGTQQSIEMFEIDKADFTLPSNWQTEVFVADWSNLSVPKLFKSEILFKKFDDIVWETDPDALVFLFIPKNVLQQSGEDEGGKGEPKNKVKGDINEKGEPDDEDGEPKDDKGDKERKNKNQKEKPGDEDGEPDDDEDGEPGDDEGDKERKNKDQKKKRSNKPGDDEGDDEGDNEGDDEGDKERKNKDQKRKRSNKPGDEPGDEPGDKPGDKKNKKPGDKEDKDGEPGDEPGDEDGEPGDEDGEPGDEDGDKKGKKSSGSRVQYKKPDDIPVSQILNNLSNNINMKREVIQDFFTRPKFGADFLKSNNFEKIKKDLNLDPNTTPLDLSQRINSQIK